MQIRETATSQSTGATTPGRLICNGEAVAEYGGAAGHTMTSLVESLREAQRQTRSLAKESGKEPHAGGVVQR